METYQELKKRQEGELNDFPIIFAFSNKQLEEGMNKHGLTIKDLDKIVSIGGGGFIKKTDADALHDLFDKHHQEFDSSINGDLTGKGFIFEAFSYELSNHEYCVTGDIQDAIDSLGFTIEEIKNNSLLQHGLSLAMNAQPEY